MKKILYSLCALTILFTVLGCADKFDLTSPDKMSPANFYRSEADAIQALAVAYSQVGAREPYYGEASMHPQEARADLVFNAELSEIGPDCPHFYTFNVLSSNSFSARMWSSRYNAIGAANKVIDNVPNIPASGITEEVRNHIMGEARFLRAYYHFTLLMDFQDIIIRDKSVTVDSDKDISSRPDVWEFVITEFEEAAKLMNPSVVVPVERATANTAYAYKAYALVNMAYESETGTFSGSVVNTEALTDALTAIAKVDGRAIIEGEGKYRSMFDGTNNNSKEVLLTCPLSNDPSFEMASMPHMSMLSEELGGYHILTPSADLLKIYEDTKLDATTYDPRALATVVWSNDHFNTEGNFPFSATLTHTPKEGEPITLVINKASQVFKAGAASFYKFVPKFDVIYDEAATAAAVFLKPAEPAPMIKVKETTVEVYIPIMRYANVILLKAECLAQQGDTGGAIAAINELRTARGIAATKEADAMKAVELERVLEFEHENSRFYDLRRWNKLGTNKTLTDRGYTTEANFMPIPAAELENNNALK